MSARLVEGNRKKGYGLALPTGGRLIQRVDHLQSIRVRLGQTVPLLSKQDILLRHVRVDQRPLGRVRLVGKSSVNELVVRGDTGSSGHANSVLQSGRLVLELRVGTLEGERTID